MPTGLWKAFAAAILIFHLTGCTEGRSPSANICETYVKMPEIAALEAIFTDRISGKTQIIVQTSSEAPFLSHGSQQIDIKTYIAIGSVENHKFIATSIHGPIQYRDSDESILGSEAVFRDSFYFDSHHHIHRIEDHGVEHFEYELLIRNHIATWVHKRSIPDKWTPSDYSGNVYDFHTSPNSSSEILKNFDALFLVSNFHYIPRPELLRPLEDSQ
jgi:hypothetical protein